MDQEAGEQGGRLNSVLLVAIAKLSHFCTIEEMSKYASSLPDAILIDNRFARAFKQRMDQLKGMK